MSDASKVNSNKSKINKERDYDNLRQLFNDGLTPKQIGEKYNVSDTIIKYHLRNMRIDLYRGKKINRKPLTDEALEIFSTLYLEGLSITKIEEQTGYDHSTIHRNLVKMGIDTSMKVYSIDESFFEKIDTEEKAWAFGILISDGGLVGTSFRVNLQIDDRDVLEKMKTALKYEGPILTQKASGKGKKDIGFLSVGRKKMVEDLIKLGCGYRKSFSVQFPTNIPENLIPHFLRGLCDGDGQIRTQGSYIMTRICSNVEFNRSLGKFLGDLGIYSTEYIVDENQISTLNIDRKAEAIKFLNYIYKDATIYMDRKFKVWNDYKTKYLPNLTE